MIDTLLGTQLVSGALLMGYLVAGLFFWRFWRTTSDRFFAIFALSFWLLAVQRFLVAASVSVFESDAYLYGIRLAAYLLILGAIVDKNRKARSAG